MQIKELLLLLLPANFTLPNITLPSFDIASLNQSITIADIQAQIYQLPSLVQSYLPTEIPQFDLSKFNINDIIVKMPLVIPGMQSSSAGPTDDWANKLMGKKIGDEHDTITFAKSDLPSEHRVLKEGDFASMDHKPDRLNIHVDGEGTVKKVTHG